MKSRIILILIVFALAISIGASKRAKVVKSDVSNAGQVKASEPIGGLVAEDR